MEIPTAAPETVRIDLWAWSVRLFKTRSLAATACRKSQLMVNGQRCRAAKLVRIGDLVQIRDEGLTREFEVLGVLRRRVAAKEVPRFLLDRTPPELAAQAARLKSESPAAPARESGAGRPTKRDRRAIERLEGNDETTSFEEFVSRYLGKDPGSNGSG